MASLVYWAPRGGLPLVDDLIGVGHTVWEALAISEVLNLIEHESVDAVIVAPEISKERAADIETHIMTLRLTDKTTTADIIWDLSLLFPSSSAVQ